MREEFFDDEDESSSDFNDGTMYRTQEGEKGKLEDLPYLVSLEKKMSYVQFNNK